MRNEKKKRQRKIGNDWLLISLQVESIHFKFRHQIWHLYTKMFMTKMFYLFYMDLWTWLPSKVTLEAKYKDMWKKAVW